MPKQTRLVDQQLSPLHAITIVIARLRIRIEQQYSIAGSPVTGRALQAENGDLEKLVLRFCIRPIDGAFELLAIMDIRARSISFTTRPRRPDGPPDHERAGETFLHLLFRLADLGGKANYYLRRSA